MNIRRNFPFGFIARGASSFAMALVACHAGYAGAQAQASAADTPTQQVDSSENDGDITVTGTRLVNPGVASSVPLTAIRVDELPMTGSSTLGDSLDRLPSLRSTSSQTNSGNVISRIGNSGLNILDLRGLGTARTLVLVNGRRHITSIPGEFVVDINTIPDQLVERIDIVTGGNSAIYGSDAVAGVVNFITKRSFEGISAEAGGSVTSRGDRGQYRLSLTAGQNFAEGRGNIAASLGYAYTDTLRAEQRDYITGVFSGQRRFFLGEPTAGEPPAGDGIPDNTFFEGFRSNSSLGGAVTAVCGATDRSNPLRCTPTGYARFYMFQPDGTLAQNNPTIDLRDLTAGAVPAMIGGLGHSYTATGNIAPGTERLTANLLAHYDVSDTLKLFAEAKYARITANAAGQPSFWSGSLTTGSMAATSAGFANNLRCNNPYLGTQALTTLQSIGFCGDVATGTFTVARFNMDLGERQELEKRNVYRIVAGVQGDFNEDWRYELSVNYGRYDGTMTSLNTLYIPNFFKALDAVRNAAGTIVCRINVDADPKNDDPACSPLNVFGNGAPSAAAINYVNKSTVQTRRASQFVASGYVAGDLSQLFELPGGPIGFVVGGEYRRETASAVYDALGTEFFLFGPGGPPFVPSPVSVKEAFGEISLPLLKHVPFADTLSLSASGRVSDYDTRTGTVYAYNLGAVYAPVRDLRLRASYSQSVRAPTLADLYAAPSAAFPVVQDPCDVLYVNTGSTTRAANCRAAGLPADFANTRTRTTSISAIASGNPNLEAETSRSLTLGGVFEPRVIPGLSFTADYYEIKVKGMIAPVTAQIILNNCYDAATLDNPYCLLITREPGTGLFAPNGVRVTTVNFAQQKTRGLDMELNYARSMLGGRVTVKALATRVFELNNYTNPAAPTTPNRQLSELGDPEWTGNLNISYATGPITFGYQLQYIGKQTIGFYESQNSFNGLPPQNADEYADPWYPAVTYHGFRIGVDAGSRFNFYAGVDNAFDKKSPFNVAASGGGAIYDIFGRTFYVGLRAKM